jgi:hypothetical protein
MSFCLRVFEKFDQLTHVCCSASEHSKIEEERGYALSPLLLGIYKLLLLLKYLKSGLSFSNIPTTRDGLHVCLASEYSKK